MQGFEAGEKKGLEDASRDARADSKLEYERGIEEGRRLQAQEP